MTAWRLAAKSTALVAVALLVVWVSLHPSVLTIWVLASPLLLLAASQARAAWRTRQQAAGWRHGAAAALAALVFGVIAHFSQPLVSRFEWLYLAQHVGVHAMLAGVFARSLLPGRTPLCTQLAAWVHDDVTEPPLWRYTRGVTVAWALYFTAVCLVSLALFRWGSFAAWTWFSTIGALAGTALMFVTENFARRFFLPAKDRIGLLRTIAVVSQQFSRP
jgi:uncharacterized membrane protein